jgi:hypothetical protein
MGIAKPGAQAVEAAEQNRRSLELERRRQEEERPAEAVPSPAAGGRKRRGDDQSRGAPRERAQGGVGRGDLVLSELDPVLRDHPCDQKRGCATSRRPPVGREGAENEGDAQPGAGDVDRPRDQLGSAVAESDQAAERGPSEREGRK